MELKRITYFVVLISGSSYWCAAVLQKPTVTALKTNILEGDAVSIKCNFNSDSAIVKYIVWFYYKDVRDAEHYLYLVNKEIVRPPNKGFNAWKNRIIERKEDFAGYSITLSNVTVADDNPVVCQIADNGYGRGAIESEPFPLIVAVRPSNATILNKTKVNSQWSKFDCMVHRVKPVNSIKFTWYFDGREIINDHNITTNLNKDQKSYSVKSSILKFLDQVDDGKSLKCVVKWTFGAHIDEVVSSDEGIVSVQFAPTWDGGSRTLSAELNTEVNVNCTVKSKPPALYTRWYKHGSNEIIHNGTTLHFSSISLKDYVDYECEVSNGVGKPSKFRITLQEGGPPRLSTFKVKENRTSTRMTLMWEAAYDGGHPPVTYFLKYKEFNDNEYKQLTTLNQTEKTVEKQMYYTAKELRPNVKYQFMLKAKNKRKEVLPSKNDTSMNLVVSEITRRSPIIEITSAEVMTDKLIVNWKYSNLPYQETYKVTVKVRYDKEHNGKFTVYPSSSSVDVSLSSLTVPIVCNSSLTSYTVSLLVYENGVLSGPAAGSKTVDCQAANQATVPWTIIIIAATSAVVIIAVVIIIAVCVRRGLNQPKYPSFYEEHIPQPSTSMIDEGYSKETHRESGNNADVNENIYAEIPEPTNNLLPSQIEDEYLDPVNLRGSSSSGKEVVLPIKTAPTSSMKIFKRQS